MSGLVSRLGLRHTKKKIELVRRIFKNEPLSSEQAMELDKWGHRIQMRSQLCGFACASIGAAAGITAFVQVGGIVTAMCPGVGCAVGGAFGLVLGIAPVTVSSLVLVGVVANRT
jgi:flavin-dependent dehydrogenase